MAISIWRTTTTATTTTTTTTLNNYRKKHLLCRAFSLKGKKTSKYPDMVVSKNRGTPKWMVYMENPIKMDDLGVPPFKDTSIYSLGYFCAKSFGWRFKILWRLWKIHCTKESTTLGSIASSHKNGSLPSDPFSIQRAENRPMDCRRFRTRKPTHV